MMFLITCGRRQLKWFISLVFLLMFGLLLTAEANDTKKIPIEQAIEEAKQAHEMCRLNKIRSLTKQREYQQALGTKGALPTQYQYDVRFYRIELEVDITTEILYGRIDMVSTATQDGVTFCEIDLHTDMITDSVFVDDTPATFSHPADLITITLPVTIDSGQSFTVTTFYHGHPAEGGFQAFSFSSYGGSPVISTLSEPYFARTWWPCKDYPDDKADSVDIIITYRSDLFCASNGELISDIDNMDGTRTTYWKHGYPITTYLVSLAMSDYSHWREWFVYLPTDSTPVDFWVYPSKLAQAQSDWGGTTVEMLAVLSDAYGLYPFPEEKYAMSMFNWGGAMEHQTNSSMNYNATYQSITVHEMGHQWWGDMITCRDWQNIWINEGFAVYSEAIWCESQGGFDDLRSYMNGIRYTSGGSIYRTDTTNVWSIFSLIVYDKAAWVLHALRHVVGDSTYFDIMHTYYDSDLKWGTATTEDFRDICEAVSGVNLHDFFQDWIYGTYYPRYSVSYDYDQLATDSFRVYVHVRQTQTTDPNVFHMPEVDVSVYNGDYYDFRVPMVAREHDYVFDIGGTTAAPAAAYIDRLDWILKITQNESYSVHLIYDSLKSGEQYTPYEDSLICRGGTAGYSYEILAGGLPGGLELEESTGIVSGIPTDDGYFEATIKVTDSGFGSDTKTISINIISMPYTPGDADANGIVEISDAVWLIYYIYNSGPAPIPEEAGDADGNCIVEVTDAVYLIAYIFTGGPAPLPGC